jgi:hypothetical protein
MRCAKAEYVVEEADSIKERPMVKYQSTGKPLTNDEEFEALKQNAQERRRHSPLAMRDAAMNKIYERSDKLAEGMPAEEAHDEAVKHFDYAYKDVISNPHLLNEVGNEYRRATLEAAKKREVIDWGRKLPEIGEAVRKRAGLPTSAEREHYEWLEEAKRARCKE